MLPQLSADQAITKAKSYVEKGEIEKAQELYQMVSQSYSSQARDILEKLSNKQDAQDLPQETIDHLITFYNQGQFSVVVGQATALVKQYSNAFVIWNILGASLFQMGKLEEAVKSYQKALTLKPDYADGYNNMGVALKEQGKFDDAIEAHQTALTINPNYAEAYCNLGLSLKSQGKLNEAIDAYQKALSLKPNDAEINKNMGVALKEQGKFDEAIEKCKKAIDLNPNYAEAYNNMGLVLKDQGKFDDAIEAHQKAIDLNPNYALAYNNLGNLFKEQGKLDAAIEAYKKALFLKTNYGEVYSNMGLVFKDQGKLDDAIEAYQKALSLKPDYAEAYSNMGNTLLDQGKLDEAIVSFNKALSVKPDYTEAHKNLGLTLLNTGQSIDSNRIKEGLDEYEWRWKTDNFLSSFRHFPRPLWDGQTSLTGKRILIWSEQGIGDTMNWSPCLSLVATQAQHVTLECQDKLVPLLSRSFPNIEVKAEDRSLDTKRDDFDLHLPMGSLYKHFIDNVLDNKKTEAYLVPDPDRVKYWKERLSSVGEGPYVGISWKSSVKSAYRLEHYPSISEWAPVLNVPNVTFINLQYVDYAEDIARVEEEFGVKIHNFDDIDQHGDIDEVAALCAALDIVVSTKVTPPMISAGVGTPTKIANWRQSSFNNILNNPNITSFEMIHRDTGQSWDNVFKSIAEKIST